MLDGQPFDGIDGTEYLGEVSACRGEVKREVVAVTDQSVGTVRQPVPVKLKPMPQAGLDNAPAGLYLVDQSVYVRHIVVGDSPEMLRDDCAKQQAPETGSRIDGEHHVSQRNPSGGLDGATVKDLQFGQQHLLNATDPLDRLRDRQT